MPVVSDIINSGTLIVNSQWIGFILDQPCFFVDNDSQQGCDRLSQLAFLMKRIVYHDRHVISGGSSPIRTCRAFLGFNQSVQNLSSRLHASVRHRRSR